MSLRRHRKRTPITNRNAAAKCRADLTSTGGIYENQNLPHYPGAWAITQHSLRADHGRPDRRAKQRATGIFDTTTRVFELAAAEGVPAAVAADRLAEQRMREVGRLRGVWLRS